ncbi:MAG TPA: dockerin type I repeat-containing protein, partial [Lacipirellula sp.]
VNWSDAATGDSFNGGVSQAVDANRPTLLTGALHGKAVASFDGDDVLESSQTNSLPAPGQGITVFAVTTGDTSGATAERLGQFGKSSGAAGQVVGFDASSASASTANGGAGFRFNDGSSLYETPLTDPGFHIVVWQVDEGATYADATMFVDGTLPANTFTGSGAGAGSAVGLNGSDLELLLGTGRSAAGGLLPNDGYSGQLAEFLVYNDQLTTGEINLVANYLSTEYGLPFAYETTLNLFAVEGLSWTGGAANFDAAWNAGDGAGGQAPASSNPFADGAQNLYLGNGGTAVFDNSTNTAAGSSVNSLRVGTAHSGLIVSGTEGSGTLLATDAKSLTIGNGLPPTGSDETGDMIVGEAGYNGTVNWASTGTLNVEGRLRIGQGGSGVFTQDAGAVSAGGVGGTLKFLAVGNGAGSQGTYNLNNGRLLPGGGLGGSELRQLRIGYSGSVGVVNVGDGVGDAGTARIESPDDIFVGHDGGDGTLVIKADGAVQLQGSTGEFRVANGGGATGLVVQDGGSVSTQGLFAIGTGDNSIGEYRLNAGDAATSGVVRVGNGGGQGSLRVGGAASFSTTNNLFVGHGDNSGSQGLVELTGSQASFQIARLENAVATEETIRWVAGASGVTPITVVGSGGAERVQLQNPSEVLANTGVNGGGNLRGDGIALSLNLSAVLNSGTLTLINNQTTHSITGFFEDAATGGLYEEGESVLGTGYNGSVTISYVGGTGNDVVLNLVASSAPTADFDSDGDVDGADLLAWQRGLGTPDGAARSDGDANGDGAVDATDLQAWTGQFGTSGGGANATTVPEPTSFGLMLVAVILVRSLL